MKACIVDKKDQDVLKEMLPEMLWKKSDFVVVAVEDDTVCASAAVRLDETFFQVEYFYVEPEFRNRGAAGCMISLIHRIARESGMDATVFTYRKDETTEDLYDMLLVKHFEDFELYDHLWTIKLKDLQLPTLKQSLETSYTELGNALSAQKNMLRNDYYATERRETRGTAPAVLKDFDEYLPDISVLEVEDEKVMGAILFEELDQALLLSLLYTKGSKQPVKLLELLVAAYQRMKKKYPEDMELYINSLDHHADALIGKLTEQRVQEEGIVVTQVYTY